MRGLAIEEDEVRRNLKDHFDDLYYMDTQKQFTLHSCDFDSVQRGNYFRGEPIRRKEVEAKVRKLRSKKAARKY